MTFSLTLLLVDGFSQIISNVSFEGNKRTKLDFLEQVVNSKPGTQLDSTILSIDVQKLRNLAIISYATYTVDSSGQDLSVHFKIEESRTFMPIIDFGFLGDNFWYLAGGEEANILGRGFKVSGFYQNIDSRNNYYISVSSPYINGTNWGGALSYKRAASVEPLYFPEQVDYLYDVDGFSATLSREFWYRHRFGVNVEYFSEIYKKVNTNIDLGPDRYTQSKWLTRLFYQYTKIYSTYFYLDGWFNRLNLEQVRNGDYEANFYLISNDLVYYHRVGAKGNFAGRIRLGIASNFVSPFAPFVLDSYVNIRGVGNRVDRGTATAVLNLEYRYTLYEGRKFAAQVVGFNDLGTFRTPGAELDDLIDPRGFRNFLGLGVRTMMKNSVNSALRLDFGYDPFNHDYGVVIGLDQYF